MQSLWLDGTNLLLAALSPWNAVDAKTGEGGSLGGAVTQVGDAVVQTGTVGSLNLRLTVTYTGGGGAIRMLVRVENIAPTATDRAVDLSFITKLDLDSARWWLSLDDCIQMGSKAESVIYENAFTGGASPFGMGQGRMGRYPCQVVTRQTSGAAWGLALAVDPDSPVVFDTRADHHPGVYTFYSTFCLGLSSRSLWNSNSASIGFLLYRTQPAWGFRSAFERYYHFFPEWFDSSRSQPGGQSITNPAEVPDYVGLRYHEGGYDLMSASSWGLNHSDGSAIDAANDAMYGVQSLQYINPFGCMFFFDNVGWYARAECIPQIIASYAESSDPARQAMARAVTNCMVVDVETHQIMHEWGYNDETGARQYYLSVSCNPEPLRAPTPTVSNLYSMAEMFEDAVIKPSLDGNLRIGIQLAGLFADNVGIPVHDGGDSNAPAYPGPVPHPGYQRGKDQFYDNDSQRVRYARHALAYRTTTKEPVVFLVAAYEGLAETLLAELRAQYGRRLMVMGNVGSAWPCGMFNTKPLDAFLLESEYNVWGGSKDDTQMRDSRIFAFQKNIAGLDYGTGHHEWTLDYARQCLCYAVFPDIQGNWARDQDVYELYVPLIRRLAVAGWQPVPHAWVVVQPTSLATSVRLERYGTNVSTGLHFALRNADSNTTAAVTVSVDSVALGIPDGALLWELVSGHKLSYSSSSGLITFGVQLPPRETLLFRFCVPRWTLLSLQATARNPRQPANLTLTAWGQFDDESAASPVVEYYLNDRLAATSTVERLEKGRFEAAASVNATGRVGLTTFSARLAQTADPGASVSAELTLPLVWHHLVHCRLDATNIPRAGRIVEMPVDFESWLRQEGETFALDTNSIRLCTADGQTALVHQYLGYPPPSVEPGTGISKAVAFLWPDVATGVGGEEGTFDLYYDSFRDPKPAVLFKPGFRAVGSLFVRLNDGRDLLFDPTGANLARIGRRGVNLTDNPGYYLRSAQIGRWNYGNGEETEWNHFGDYEAFSNTLLESGPLVARLWFGHGPKIFAGGQTLNTNYAAYGSITDVFRDGTIQVAASIRYGSGPIDEIVQIKKKFESTNKVAIFVDPRGHVRSSATAVEVTPTAAEWWFGEQYQSTVPDRYAATVVPDPSWVGAWLHPDGQFPIWGTTDELSFRSIATGAGQVNTFLSLHLFDWADFASLTNKVRSYLPMGLEAETDSDGDGLPDGWEFAYLGTLDYSGADDPDGDRVTNHAEYIAGTHPANPKSYFRVLDARLELPKGVALTWASVPGKNYDVYWAEELSLSPKSWSLAVAAYPASDGASTTWLDSGDPISGRPAPLEPGAPTRYYRLRVVPP